MTKKTNLLAELSDIKRLSGIIKESLDNNVIQVWENNNKADGTYGAYEFHTVNMDEQTNGEFTKYQPGDTLIAHRNVLVRVIPGTNSTVNESKINEVGFTSDGNPMGFADDGNSEEDIKAFDSEHGAPQQTGEDTKQYANIVFLQGHEAEEPLQILNDQGADAALQYLMQWDNGEYHDISGAPFGSKDRLYKQGEYVMAYNAPIGYIGLSKVMPDNDATLGEDDENGDMDRAMAAMSLAKTLAQENAEYTVKNGDTKSVTSSGDVRMVTNNGMVADPNKKIKKFKAQQQKGQFRKLSEVFTKVD